MTVVYSTGSRVLKKSVSEDEIKLTFIRYPIYPWGNNETTHIILSDGIIYAYMTRNNWNGTGREDLGHVRLTEEEYKDLYEKMMNVENLDDFFEILKIFGKMRKEREEKFDKVVDELVEEFLALELYDRALRYTEDDEIIEKLREEVREIIDEYAENEVVSELLNKIKSRIEEFLTT